jgi:DNA-binding transcriptional regulator LsrR (DeoR family)
MEDRMGLSREKVRRLLALGRIVDRPINGCVIGQDHWAGRAMPGRAMRSCGPDTTGTLRAPPARGGATGRATDEAVAARLLAQGISGHCNQNPTHRIKD